MNDRAALRVLPVAAFRCEPHSRTMTRDECIDTARHAHAAPGPKVDRPCTTCPIGEAHMRGETLAGVQAMPEAAKRSNAPVLVQVHGEWVSMSEAQRRTGLDRQTIRYRQRSGIPLETPKRQQRSKVAAPQTVTHCERCDSSWDARVMEDRKQAIRVLRALGYTAEATTIDGAEVLLVRGPV